MTNFARNPFPQSFDEWMTLALKSKKQFFMPFIAVLALVAAVYPFVPRLYMATTLVHVNNDQLIQPFVATKDQLSENEWAREKDIDALTIKIQGLSNIRSLAEKLGLTEKIKGPKKMKAALIRMSRRIRVKKLPGNILEISFRHGDPKIAQMGVDQIAENFISMERKEKQEAAASAIEFIEDQLRIYSQKIHTFDQTALNNKTQDDLEDALKRRSLALDQIVQLEKSMAPRNGDENPAILKLKNDLLASKMKLQQQEIHILPDSPIAKEQQAKINELESLLSAAAETNAPAMSAINNPAYLMALRELKQANLDITYLTKSLPRGGEAAPPAATSKE